VRQASFERQPEFMAMKWNSTVDRQQCELTGTKSAREFRSFEFLTTQGTRRIVWKIAAYENLD
jgi:hypothetical protein